MDLYKRFVVFCIFLSATLGVFAQQFKDKTSFEKYLVEGQWVSKDFGDGDFYLTFREGKYFIRDFFDPGPDLCSGLYTITNIDLVVLKYPNQIEVEIKWLFPNHDDVSLTLDLNYMDFDSKACLRNNGKYLTNALDESPYGRTYKLDGYDVVKYNIKEHAVLILENLRLRRLPEVNAPIVNVYYDNYPEELGISIPSSIIPQNYIVNFDAVTVKKDRIDGITAPWYRIYVAEKMFYTPVWVFGGYVRELTIEEMKSTIFRKRYHEQFY